MTPVYVVKTQCRECMRRRECASVSRFGGGNWRRGGRSYSSSICEQCAVSLLVGYYGPSASSLSRWSALGLIDAVAAWSGLTRDQVKEFFMMLNRHREEIRREYSDRPWTTPYFDPWPKYQAHLERVKG